MTKPAELKRWFLRSARLSQLKGGDYHFVWQDGYNHSGKVLEYVRHQRLVLSWPQYWTKKKLAGTTRVNFNLKRKGKGTILTLKPTGYKGGDQWVELYASTSSGWAYYLMNLKSVLEHKHDLRSAYDS